MKKLNPFIQLVMIMISCASFATYAGPSENDISTQARIILAGMSLDEKIGQKLMLDFRVWCPAGEPLCLQNLTVINPEIKQIISQHYIGGIILFSNNLNDVEQITTLIDGLQQAMTDTKHLPLLIGTDQEGGIVARLPRNVSATFPGNMAIAAAYFGDKEKSYATEVGKYLARDLKAVGINIDFAPDVDVNVNPLNPVINVRSFSDDPGIVSELGLELSRAIQQEGVAATIKHFPGHGDTVADSHLGLPVVSHSAEQAWNIDLYPFKYIIEKNSPDLIMTAHIQYPALDDSQIYAGKAGISIIAPATLSRKIQHDILRQQLGYQGIVISDALNMGAIAQNFDSVDATIKTFQAGVDIALMPVAVTNLKEVDNLIALITNIKTALSNGTLSADEFDESVLRIIKLKIKLGLLHPDATPLVEKISRAKAIITDKEQHELESILTDNAVTLVKNDNSFVPINPSPGTRIYILTPWQEQGDGIATEIKILQSEGRLPQSLQVSNAKMVTMDLAAQQRVVDNADIVIVGNSTTKSASLMNPAISNFMSLSLGRESSFQLQANQSLVFPDMLPADSEKVVKSPFFSLEVTNPALTDEQTALLAFQVLQYAKSKNKKTIFISMLAPYDLPNYASVSDVMLAGFDRYGYLAVGSSGYYRGPSMQALTRVIFGVSHARGRLPIDVPNPNPSDSKGVSYKRGDGLST